MKNLEKYKDYRKAMNEKIFALKNKQINRFFAIDTAIYREGALSVKTKELMGLATSTVLRCEDCITYHIIRVVQEGATDDEIAETFAVALAVGGTIAIPEMRRAMETLSILREKQEKGESIEELL